MCRATLVSQTIEVLKLGDNSIGAYLDDDDDWVFVVAGGGGVVAGDASKLREVNERGGSAFRIKSGRTRIGTSRAGSTTSVGLTAHR